MNTLRFNGAHSEVHAINPERANRKLTSACGVSSVTVISAVRMMSADNWLAATIASGIAFAPRVAKLNV